MCMFCSSMAKKNIWLCFNKAVFLVLCYLHGAKGKQPFEIIVESKIKEYGENLKLFCKIDKCCPKEAGWKVDNDLLFIDIVRLYSVLNLTNNARYKPSYSPTGVTLVIQNFSSSDLNTTHKCCYANDQTNITLHYNDVFSSIVTTKSSETTTDNKPPVNDQMTIKIVTPVVIVVLVGIVVLVFVIVKRRGTLHSSCFQTTREGRDRTSQSQQGQIEMQQPMMGP